MPLIEALDEIAQHDIGHDQLLVPSAARPAMQKPRDLDDQRQAQR
jgi:hypothetical protein